MLDHFFEDELLPRFNQARNLRTASASRKIGALRDAVAVAFETTIEQQSRRGSDLSADAHSIEERLRIVTGEVGEQRSVLDHAFFTLGEAPERILNLTAETALAWMRASSKASITPAQISEWLQDAVRNSVEPIIERAGSVSRHAIDTLRVVAHEMDRSDRPEPSEADTLLRDIPRFELGIPQEGINLSAWMFLGNGVVRARIKNTLLKSIGAEVKHSLHLYGQALSQWCHQYVSKIVVLVSSHADAYRAHLQRIAGTSNDQVDVPRLEQDLATLRNWTAKEHSGEMLHRG